MCQRCIRDSNVQRVHIVPGALARRLSLATGGSGDCPAANGGAVTSTSVEPVGSPRGRRCAANRRHAVRRLCRPSLGVSGYELFTASRVVHRARSLSTL